MFLYSINVKKKIFFFFGGGGGGRGIPGPSPNHGQLAMVMINFCFHIPIREGVFQIAFRKEKLRLLNPVSYTN